MREWMLLFLVAAVFGVGYFIMRRVDGWIDESRRIRFARKRGEHRCVRLGAETPALLDAAGPALELCREGNPYLELMLEKGKAPRLLKRLLHSEVDIVLLGRDSGKELSDDYLAIPFPAQEGSYIVWNRMAVSRDRDQVIAALESEHYRIRSGYCDYCDGPG